MSLATLVETLRRPALLGLAGKKIERRARLDLQGYFRHLGEAIRGQNLAATVEMGTKELALHAVDMKLYNVLRLQRPLLQQILTINLIEAMLTADKTDAFAEATSSDPLADLSFQDLVDDVLTGNNIEQEIDKLGLSGRAAAAWAEAHAADLVVGIDATTQTLIGRAVALGIAEQLGVDGTAKLIQATIDGMTKARARSIARTEMNAAMSEAALQKMQRIGIQYKRWILSPDACPICEDNAAEGAIPFDDNFPSGDERPPAHPNCRCAVVGAREPKGIN